MTQDEQPGTQRIGRRLYRMMPVHNKEGTVIDHVAMALHVELYPRDIMQIVAGASFASMTVVFSEELWTLGATLPLLNLIGMLSLSLIGVSLFVYFNMYRDHLAEHKSAFVQRIVAIFLISFLLGALILTLLGKASWATEPAIALRRVLLLTCLTSMAGAIGDNLN